MAKQTKTKYPISFETFLEMSDFLIDNLKSDSPSCNNGFVRIKKFKVTIEVIEEPVEVLSGRLQKLWDESDNYHHHKPLQNAANNIGYTLKGSRGNKRKT